MRPLTTVCILGACLACLQAASIDSSATVPSPAAASAARLTEAYGKLPLYFEPNLGQAPGGVRYLTRVPGATILLRDTEAVIQLRRVEANNKGQLLEPGEKSLAPGKVEGATVRMRLAGATPPRRVEPLEKLPGISNYFVGRDPKQWRTDIPQYQRVRYEQVYPGVDVVYYGNGQQLQYDFTVNAGAEPGRIQLEFEGMKGLRIEESGDLLLKTALGDLRLAKPVVYQESEAGRRPVEAGYRLLAEGRVGFTIGEYDRSRRLVIDPTLVYSMYLGGATNSTYGLGVAVDAAGNAYITGYTYANDFPTVNPVQAGLVYSSDVFVSKLNSTGTALVWSTYLGGSGYDFGYDIALDASGNAYVSGYTNSSDFPMVNAAQSTYGGGSSDAFVAKLSSSGNSLVYSTFLGGSNYEYGRGIAVNPSSGDAYVIGETYSTDFPVQAPYQAALSGYADAFVAKFNAAGVRQFSTYLGGRSIDIGYRIALDGSGNAFVTGYSCSDNFPTTPGVVQTSSHGCDAFVTKMASNGSSLVYSTYLGGSNTDVAYGIAVHSSGSAYITGYTYSSDFPTTPGAVQTSLQGLEDAFVAKLNPSGTALSFSTFLGGGKFEYPQDIAVDEPAGNVYITGHTSSGDFPTANALQPLKPNPGTVLYRTGDGGGGWSLADSGLSANNVSALSIDPGTPSTVVAGTDNGIYRTTDSGSNWSQASGSSASVLARSPSDPTVIYASNGGSVYQSTDGGASWVDRGSFSGYIQVLAVHPTISETFYAGTSGGGVYRSVDSGASWSAVNSGLGNLDVRSLVIDPTNANVLYAGTNSSVYKTTNGAASWSAASTGMTSVEVSALAMAPGNSSVLYALVYGCIYNTTNAAATWNSLACPGSGSTSLVVAPSNPAVLYAGTYSSVWRSADAGVTWNPANIGIADRNIYSLAVHPTNPSVVYAGTNVTDDAFVTKLNPAGTTYVYSTYLGGPQGSGIGYGIAADSSGNAYVTGYTSSYSFPTTAGALERSSQTVQAFVAKISDVTASCSYEVNPASQFFYSGGGTANFSVVSPSGCAWTAAPGAGWVGVTNGSSGTGVGAVSISVGSNSDAARSGNLVVGGQTIAITQGASGCSYSLSTHNISAPPGGGSYDVTLTTGAGCDWVVQNPYSWITVTPSSSGSGSGAFTVTLGANPNFNSPYGYIYIGGQYLYVTQAGTCLYSLSSPSAAVDWTGGARSVDVTCSNPECSWGVGWNASWLSITSYGGKGSGTVNYTVAANTTGATRSGTLTIAGQTFTVTQAPQLQFVPITPCRVADTRNADGPFGGPFIPGNTSRNFDILAGSCGIPANALAYSFNVTVTPSGPLLYLSMWPAGQPLPIVSTLNALDGRWTANAAIVPAGANGSISVFVSDPTHVILDINGYFVPASSVGSLAFYPLTPCRVMDTRGGTSIGAGGTRTVPVRSSGCSVPSGAVAYALNFTALPHGPLGWITTWPTGSPMPTASTLNAPTGTITANAAILPAGTDGSVDVYASDATDLLVDINGYFAPPGTGGLSFATLTPCRIVDTRNPNGPFGGPDLLGARDFAVAASACGVPSGAQAYSLNATVWPKTGFLNWLTLWPAGAAMPGVSTLNSWDGRLVANAAIVPTTSNSVSAYASDLTTFLLDINGYFAP